MAIGLSGFAKTKKGPGCFHLLLILQAWDFRSLLNAFNGCWGCSAFQLLFTAALCWIPLPIVGTQGAGDDFSYS
jgi:hypothetical protein